MTTLKQGTLTKRSGTVPDTDLVEISGYHAYKNYSPKEKVNVNGNIYRVLEKHTDTANGLNAITFQSVETKEILIAYTGTDTKDKKDLLTDAQLLSDMVPEQVQAAQDYFDETEKKFGTVSYVCGNSLGGGNANAVGVANPHVKTVTLNPALLPDGVVDSNKEYKNITNYFGRYDVLTSTITGLFLGHRIPGEQVEINHGIPSFEYLSTNHTGYIGKNEAGQQMYVIGELGQPGYGAIYIDADAGVVSSIWTGQSLHSGSSERIDLNTDHLFDLSKSMESHVSSRMALVYAYLQNSADIVEHEGSRYYERLHTLQESFREMFEDAAQNPLFNGITSTGNIIKTEIYHLISLLDSAESKAQSLNYFLNSPPAELMEFVMNKDINVESLFADARNFLYNLRSSVEELTDFLPNLVNNKIPELFEGGTDRFTDAVVGEFMAHFKILAKNNVTVKEHMKSYGQDVSATAEHFKERDSLLAGGISTGIPPSLALPDISAPGDHTLLDSPYLKMGMKLLDIQLEMAILAFTDVTHKLLLPLLVGLESIAVLLEGVLEGISDAINGAVYVILNGSLPVKLAGMFTDFDDKIRAMVQDALEPIDELADTVEGVRKGLGNLIVFYPVLVQKFKPYLESALFSQTSYYNIHLYNSAATGILEEMDLLFKDIVFQMSHNKGLAIDALCDVSEKVKYNLVMMHEQVDRGTIG
ncbi:SA1320 family protein [Fictibacillus iocasae]|uniref:SA1320 family protein n=1 Tax=Fictibacillus iocasae TaxID=2715437 RepID=A0ABW2NMQ5_9BACL